MAQQHRCHLRSLVVRIDAYGAAVSVPTATECRRVPMVEPAVVLDGPFRYAAAGCEIRVSTPARDRDLWHEYLDGALANYLRYGVESVLEYKTVRPGRTTTMFFAAVDPSGAVIGGMRVQGPYSDPGQAHALTEWAGRPGTAELRDEIASRIGPDLHGNRQGVIEMKTGWVAPDAPHKRELTAALARVFLHAIKLTGVRYALGTVATHAVPKWSTTGGEISSRVTPVAYPDARYRTVPMWWDRDKKLSPELDAKMGDEQHRMLWSDLAKLTQVADTAA